MGLKILKDLNSQLYDTCTKKCFCNWRSLKLQWLFYRLPGKGITDSEFYVWNLLVFDFRLACNTLYCPNTCIVILTYVVHRLFKVIKYTHSDLNNSVRIFKFVIYHSFMIQRYCDKCLRNSAHPREPFSSIVEALVRSMFVGWLVSHYNARRPSAVSTILRLIHSLV